ncbi:flagellar basal body-associated FliL family protein [Candidatus Kuenenia stuttgartensis]|uniref:flagellar basal body-associated FliL family protein n=1 Tax=Kuenenia stuttgartiensis TaxID=174633 RepID=UPI00146D3BCB|nr:flagellar basal body-associated FliL family protein [Candidatus Kuenenia stuttgartiensis]
MKSDKDPKEAFAARPLLLSTHRYNCCDLQAGLISEGISRQTKVILEVRNEEARGKLETRTIQVKDRLISILSSKTIDDIDSVEGREYIKREIKDSVDVILNMEKAVLQVYFEDFVVQ